MDEENTGLGTGLIVAGGIGCLLLVLGLVSFVFLARSEVAPTMTPAGATVTTVDGNSVLEQTHRQELASGDWLQVVTQMVGTDLRKRVMRIEAEDGGVEEFRGIWREDGTLDVRESGHFVDGVRLGDLTPEKQEELADWTMP